MKKNTSYTVDDIFIKCYTQLIPKQGFDHFQPLLPIIQQWNDGKKAKCAVKCCTVCTDRYVNTVSDW